MHCTNCGAELEAGAKFCTSCGTRVEAAPEPAPANEAPVTPEITAEAAAPAPEAPAEKKDAIGDLIGKAKSFFSGLWAKVKPALKKADDKAGEVLGNKKIYAYAGVIALLGIIIVIAAVAGLIPESNGYLSYERTNIGFEDEQLYAIKEGKAVKLKTDAETIGGTSWSIDGKVCVFMTEEMDIYSLKGKKTALIAEDVSDYTLSLYGDAVVYTVVEDASEVYYYCKLGKDPVEIFESELEAMLTSFIISPDGKSVAYTVYEGELDRDVYFFNGKESEKIASFEGNLIGMSNGGKYIYALSDLDEKANRNLYCLNKKGEKEKIDRVGSENFYFNLDCTEIMFFEDGRSYISVKGKEPVKAASATLSLIAPRYTSPYLYRNPEENAAIYPVDSLYDHVYSGDGNLYYVSKRDSKNVKLANTDGDIFLDDSAEYVYYMDDEELKCLKISDGSNAKDRAKVIAEDVEDYVVTSDRKYVYFISDESVCVVNGKKGGKPKTLSADDVSGYLVISKDDVVYYESDDTIYGIKGKSKGKKIMDDAIAQNIGGYVYISDEDALYAARGTGKPKKILENE